MEVFLLLWFPDQVAQVVLTETSEWRAFPGQLGDTLAGSFDPLDFMLLRFVQRHVKNTLKETEIFFLISKRYAAVQ